MLATQRLYLTRDRKKLVADGDPKAATLYAVPGDEIPASAVEMFGLVDGGLKKSAKTGDDKPVTSEAKGGAADITAKPGRPAKTKPAKTKPAKTKAAKTKAAKLAAAKETPPAEDKEAAPGEDKEAEPAEDKSAGGAGHPAADEGAGS